VSFVRGLKRLSISHVIFGGGRYINNSGIAEAQCILAKALNGAGLGRRGVAMPDRDAYLDRAPPSLQKAIALARGFRDPARLMLAYNTSAENYLLKGNYDAAIKDAEQALKISDANAHLKDYADPHATLAKAYDAEQKYARAVEHLHR